MSSSCLALSAFNLSTVLSMFCCRDVINYRSKKRGSFTTYSVLCWSAAAKLSHNFSHCASYLVINIVSCWDLAYCSLSILLWWLSMLLISCSCFSLWLSISWVCFTCTFNHQIYAGKWVTHGVPGACPTDQHVFSSVLVLPSRVLAPLQSFSMSLGHRGCSGTAICSQVQQFM